jgi:predicted RNase H-like nuclease/RimJ/RimL family protein N-acetyltransferase
MPGPLGEVGETGTVAHPYWPLFDLRVRTPRLELRPPTDEDLLQVVDLVRHGIHEPGMMPFSTPWTDAPSPDLERNTLQWNWRQRAEWTKDSWGLGFVVVHHDPEPTIVGVQDLFAKNFWTTRVAESGSWLGRAHQGKGIGKEMRAAVLHFAFAGLGARWCETFAWEDNASSLGVTERLGYEPNGVEMDLRRGEGQALRRFRMTREAWVPRRRRDIRIGGLEHCLEMFGLPQAVAGADACRGGWCVVTLPVDGDTTVEVLDRFAKVATRQAKGRLGAIGVDIPIGLSDGPPRQCDVDARALLGDRRSSVFPAPVRPVLGARSFEQALSRSRSASGLGLSKQSWHLVPKITEVDRLLDPTRQGRIFECHPEAAFAALRGVPMAHPKKGRPGRDERLAVLGPHVPGIDALVAKPPSGAAADDVLDAAVVALTAKAVLAGKARRLGERRHDAKGLVMEIVVPEAGAFP